jgi:hypothetical protein
MTNLFYDTPLVRTYALYVPYVQLISAYYSLTTQNPMVAICQLLEH